MVALPHPRSTGSTAPSANQRYLSQRGMNICQSNLLTEGAICQLKHGNTREHSAMLTMEKKLLMFFDYFPPFLASLYLEAYTRHTKRRKTKR
jgi:hypothetical protein